MFVAGVRLIAATAVLLLLSPAVFAQDADTPEARRAAALRYMNVSPLAKQMEDGIAELASLLPPRERQQFIEEARRMLPMEKLERAVIDTMVKTFTTNELNALADFYSSPVGRSALDKFGIYTAEVMQAMQREARVLEEPREGLRGQCVGGHVYGDERVSGDDVRGP